MTEPIPVKDALKLIEMALADCDKAQVRTAPPDWFDGGAAAEEPALTVLARATMRPLLALVKLELVNEYGADESVQPLEALLYPPLAALRDHYDAVRPGWRER